MFEPIKELGQNFLIDSETITRMVDYLEPADGDLIVEVGPGLGALTEELSNRVLDNSEVYAIEIDKRFVSKLENMFLESLNLNIIEGNILDWLPNFKPNKPYKLLGSLPYYIASPIIHTIIKAPKQAETVVILIQKEVGEKVAARVPDATYFSSFVQTFYDVEYLESVPKTHFDPIPEVDGAIIRMKKLPEQNISRELIEKYEGFLHKGYANPRKMLNKAFSKEELQLVEVDGNLRAQDIDVEKWVEMFNKLVL
ncbi:MAG: hypothetical protein ACD_24C00407G0003 [uncultured bacterium]|nr:MAG: hypothetical protein ACD_24C00407G0003 [uncultured bacterium]